MAAVAFSRDALDKARRLAQARGAILHWVLQDLRTYAPEPGADNLVLVANLHLPPVERAAVLAGAAAALAPHGRLLVIGYDLASLTEGLVAHRTRQCSPPPGHRRRAGRGHRPSCRMSPLAGRHRAGAGCSGRHLVRATRD